MELLWKNTWQARHGTSFFVNKFSFTMRQQGTLRYVLSIGIMICIILSCCCCCFIWVIYQLSLGLLNLIDGNQVTSQRLRNNTNIQVTIRSKIDQREQYELSLNSRNPVSIPLEGIYRPDSQGPSLNYIYYSILLKPFYYSSSVFNKWIASRRTKTERPCKAQFIRINTIYKLFAWFWIVLSPEF